MKKRKCYIYTRVSTAMQVDGYSLEAQKEKLKKYAAYEEMQIVGEYSDEGHSGKNIAGRPEFIRMLKDIEAKIESVSLRIDNLHKNKLSGEAVYQILLQFDKMYSEFTDLEKKRFLKSFVKDVFVHEQELPDGRFLKGIKFRFPIFYNGVETDQLDFDSYWDKETNDDTVMVMC